MGCHLTETKVVPAWLVGNRDAETAEIFLTDLASRLKHRVQLTTDGHSAYLEAVEGALGCDIEYAQLVKLCASDVEGNRGIARRRSLEPKETS